MLRRSESREPQFAGVIAFLYRVQQIEPVVAKERTMTELRELISYPLHYEFDEFHVDVRQRLLLRNGEAVALQPKLFALLLTLLRNPGVELDKEFLMRSVWPDCRVEMANLTQSIFLLRRALGQSSDGRRFILTLPGQGYLFTGTLRTDMRQNIAPEPAAVETAGQGTERRSIAVVPFHVLDCSDQTQYLGVGIADALIHHLSRNDQLDIRPTGTILHYAGRVQNPQDIGRDLGVGMLITGTIQVERHREASASKVRVTVQLVSVADGRLVWSDSLKHDLSNLLSLQDELIESIGQAVSMRLALRQRNRLAKRYTEDNQAYRDYLRGRYYAQQWTIRGWTKSIECFSKAVQHDPAFALAYCGIADAHYMASNLYFPPVEVMPKSQAAASRALQLDDSLAEAHTSVALVKGFFEWNWKQAEASFRQAIHLDPRYAAGHFWYARLLCTAGRFDEAIRELRMSQRLDPLSPAINAELGRVMYYARRYDEATSQLRETLELHPDFWPAHLFLGWVYEQQGPFTEAIAILHRGTAIDDNPRTTASLGIAYAFAGNEAEADSTLLSLMRASKTKHVSAYYIAAIYSALGHHSQAFRWFQKALADRSEWLVWLRVDPRFDGLRQDERFESLVRKVGIPDRRERASEAAAGCGRIRLVESGGRD